MKHKIKEELCNPSIKRRIWQFNERVNVCDFHSIKIIGRGAFGEVRLVRFKEDQKLYAVKKLKKCEISRKNQTIHIRNEKDVLKQSDSKFIVKLQFTFQDNKHLYFVTEFVQGGDLMNLLIKLDIFEESMARF